MTVPTNGSPRAAGAAANGTAVVPNTPPPVADDTIQDVQLRGLSRWSPRRAGLPALLDWWPSYFLLAMLAVLVVLVTGRLLVDVLAPFGHVIVVAGVAAIVTFALAPLVTRLETRMPRRVAATLVFVGTVLGLLGVGGLLVWQLAFESERFTHQIDEVSATLQGLRPLDFGPYRIPLNLQERLRDLFLTSAPAIAGYTAGIAGAVLSSLIDLVLILVVTFYLLLDARRFRVVLLRSLEPARRPATRRVFTHVARIFGAYVRAQLTVAVSLGILVAVTMWVIGMPYALFLGLFAALAELMPMIGPWVGAIPALLVALSLPFPTIVWVALAFLVIQQLESNVLLPRLSAHAVGIHPIGAILALILGFEVGGIVGALFAVPIAGLIWVLLSTAIDAWRGSRMELQRRLDVRAIGWPDGRPSPSARRDLRQLRPRRP